MSFLQIDLVGWLPDRFKQQIIDGIVTSVSQQAEKAGRGGLSQALKRLRSDAAFQQAVDRGLRDATDRFVREYTVQDEDLVAAIARDPDFWETESVREALLKIIQRPNVYLAEEQIALARSFADVLRQRVNRERVDRAVSFYLRCVAESLWHLEPIRPIYEMQMQRLSVERATEIVQEMRGLRADVRGAMLGVVEAIGEQQKILAAPDRLALPEPKKVYHNLPQPDYGAFIGREKELAQVHGLLRPYPHSRHHVVVIDGIGGIGKSALALEVAHRYLRDYDRLPQEERFDAIIWTSAKSSVLTAGGIISRRQITRTLDDIYATISVALEREDITRARPEEQDELVVKALTQQRTLLIVDNLETLDDERVNAFLRELPAPTKAIVTTRHRIDVAYPVRLTGMPQEDGLVLIAEECLKKSVTLTEAEAEKLYNRTGGVPLAIAWSISQMGFGYGVEAVLTRLGQPSSDITRFCFETTMAAIGGTSAHKALMALSLFAIDASREGIGYVADFGPDILTRDEALATLQKLSLADKESDRFYMLPLTRSFANSELQHFGTDKDVLIERWIDFFVDFAEKHGGINTKDFARLEVDYKNIDQVVNWLAVSKNSSRRLLRLIKALAPFLFVKGLWSVWNSWLELGKQTAIEQNDELSLGDALFGLGQLDVYRREPKSARRNLEDARFIFERYHQNPELIESAAFLARAYMFGGPEEDSQADYQKAEQILKECQQLADRVILHGQMVSSNAALLEAQAIIHCFKGQMFTELGESDEAERCFSEALITHGERASAGLTFIYWGLGAIYIEKGNYERARQYLSRSIQIANELQTATGRVQAQRWLAILEEKAGNLAKARSYALSAKEGALRLGMKFHVKQMERLIERVDQIL